VGSVATLVIYFGHVHNKLDHTARVAPFVVVPRDQFHKVGVEGDPSSGVEDGRVRVTHKVSRDNRVVSVAEDTLCSA
jgi:hypothetical protein